MEGVSAPDMSRRGNTAVTHSPRTCVRGYKGWHEIGRFIDASRTSPLSPALSPEYRGERAKGARRRRRR